MYCEADQQFSLTGSDVVVYKNPHHVDDASSPTETYNIRYYSRVNFIQLVFLECKVITNFKCELVSF